jgi:hypothetical protein
VYYIVILQLTKHDTILSKSGVGEISAVKILSTTAIFDRRRRRICLRKLLLMRP